MRLAIHTKLWLSTRRGRRFRKTVQYIPWTWSVKDRALRSVCQGLEVDYMIPRAGRLEFGELNVTSASDAKPRTGESRSSLHGQPVVRVI